MSSNGGPAWLEGFKADYQHVFVEEWSPFLGGILLVMIVIGLMVSGLFWGVFGGIRLWGDWLNHFIGLGPLLGVSGDLEGPLMQRLSLMNITLVLGAFSAALLSRQFAVNRPPRLEYVWAALGGSLMGLGASLAGGCTVGGFLIPTLYSSPAGWSMWVGLVVGAIVGVKLLLWTLDHVSWGMTPPPVWKTPAGVQKAFPWLGLAVFVGIAVWTAGWWGSGDEKLAARAVIVLGGFALGFVMHRSRFCVARAFREPFMTAEGHMTKAVILTLAIGIPLAALLFERKLADPYLAIPATFWLGSLIGGVVFGVGMIFAGGCGTGSLWRMGEGHAKLWVAVFFFAWVGSISYGLLKKAGLNVRDVALDGYEFTALGYQAYLPAMSEGWVWALAVSGGLLLVWYALVRYNESTEKFTLL